MCYHGVDSNPSRRTQVEGWDSKVEELGEYLGMARTPAPAMAVGFGITSITKIATLSIFHLIVGGKHIFFLIFFCLW